jgi:hypothetical protein
MIDICLGDRQGDIQIEREFYRRADGKIKTGKEIGRRKDGEKECKKEELDCSERKKEI